MDNLNPDIEAQALDFALALSERRYEPSSPASSMLVLTAYLGSIERTSVQVERALRMLDEGGVSCGALVDCARALVLSVEEEKARLIVPLQPSPTTERKLWLGGLARDSAQGLVPRIDVAWTKMPVLDQDQEARLKEQEHRVDRYLRIARQERRKSASISTSLRVEVALRQAEQHRIQARSIRNALITPLLEKAKEAKPTKALEVGRPLSQLLDRDDHQPVFNLLGRSASVEDLAALDETTLRRFGLGEEEVVAIARA